MPSRAAPLDYAVGVAVNGVYSPAKADRKAGWFWPAQASPHTATAALFQCSTTTQSGFQSLGSLPESACLSCAQKESGQHHFAGGEVTGETLQIALCRAIVLRELGSLVEVPEEYKESA